MLSREAGHQYSSYSFSTQCFSASFNEAGGKLRSQLSVTCVPSGHLAPPPFLLRCDQLDILPSSSTGSSLHTPIAVLTIRTCDRLGYGGSGSTRGTTTGTAHAPKQSQHGCRASGLRGSVSHIFRRNDPARLGARLNTGLRHHKYAVCY